MTLENITGNLLKYKELESGTFQHVDQITTERRTNSGLRNQFFYTADGEVYTVQRGEYLWGITREPQNLVLQDIDEAYRQLRNQENYFPDAEAAESSLGHSDTVVVDLKGLELVKNSDEYGHFVVNPKRVEELNSQQRIAARRIYGPDEKSFEENMEMFAKAKINPNVFVLMPEYVQDTLQGNDKKFLWRASWLADFNGNSDFSADDRGVDDHDTLRGVRRVVAEGDAPKNNQVQPASQEITLDTCYQRLLADHAQAVQALDNQRVAGLSRIVADYLATRAK